MASTRAPVSSVPSQTAIRRLSRDLQKLKEEPIEGIDAYPLEENILEWHYIIRGSKGTPFEGGIYHGKLVFPCEFPWKPPSIYMFTPNGRFLPNQRLCLSISDYHPETWNPGWTVSAILVGLHSFMNETSIATGTESTTPERKKELAVKSLSFNLRDHNFCKLFPTVVTELQSKGVEKMTDAQATEETSRAMPRYARAAAAVMGNPGDPDFLQNARQHMMAMQNEMEAAMRAAMRDLPQPQQFANPILPDDLFFNGVNMGVPPRPMMGGVQQGGMLQQPQMMPGPPPLPPAAAAPPPVGIVQPNPYGGGGFGAVRDAVRNDMMMMDFAPLPMPPRPPAVAVIQGMQQVQPMQQPQQIMQLAMQAGPAAGPVRRPAEDDAEGLNPPPAKRLPDVVTLD